MSFRPVPSADGSVVTFLSLARNLVSGDTSPGNQAYAVKTASVMSSSAPDDTTAPTVAFSSPAAGATVTNPVTFSGTVSDAGGVQTVDLGIRRGTSTTGFTWLQADGTTWAATAYRAPAAVDTAAGTWSVTAWGSLPDGSYSAQVRAFDTSRNTSNKFQAFKVATASTDTTAPTATITSPANNATGVTSPVTVTGTASDDVAIRNVSVGVKNTATGMWLQSDGSWATTPAYKHAATLTAAGTSSTDWSKSFTLPAGKYRAEAQAWDTSGNVLATKPATVFTVITS